MIVLPHLRLPVFPRIWATFSHEVACTPDIKVVSFDLMKLQRIRSDAQDEFFLFYECSECGHASCPSFSCTEKEIPMEVMERLREHAELKHA